MFDRSRSTGVAANSNSQSHTLHPAPCTLHPAPCTPHQTSAAPTSGWWAMCATNPASRPASPTSYRCSKSRSEPVSGVVLSMDFFYMFLAPVLVLDFSFWYRFLSWPSVVGVRCLDLGWIGKGDVATSPASRPARPTSYRCSKSRSEPGVWVRCLRFGA